MIPKHVLLIHRHNDHYRRLTGWWSYPVSEFTWDERCVNPDNFTLDLLREAGRYDLAVLDDWCFGEINHPTIPLAYVVVDSARSDNRLKRNLQQAQQSDLVLVDSDDLTKFGGHRTRRFAYAVNERLFRPHEKLYDVAFLCWPTPERRAIQDTIREICQRRGWSFLTGTWTQAEDYARAIGSAKVVIHAPHVKAARSWRVFDVMASHGCLLTAPIPKVSGDGIEVGRHYQTYADPEQIERRLIELLTDDEWCKIAETGYHHVMNNHTWSVRAKQLQHTLSEVFKWV